MALRDPSAEDSGRVKAWRKVAREGLLPPALLYFVSGLDSWLVLDGHDRLLAARLEGVAPTALTLSSVRTRTWTPNPEEHARTQNALERQLETEPDAARVRGINTRLIALYAEPSQVVPRTRVYPLRDWPSDAERLVRGGAPRELLDAK